MAPQGHIVGLKCIVLLTSISVIMSRRPARCIRLPAAGTHPRSRSQFATRFSRLGNAALVEREAVTLPLDHAIGFELGDIGPAAIEMQRQRRRADGRGLSGSPSTGRLGGGRAISADDLGQLFVLVRRGNQLIYPFWRHSGLFRSCCWLNPGREWPASKTSGLSGLGLS